MRFTKLKGKTEEASVIIKELIERNGIWALELGGSSIQPSPYHLPADDIQEPILVSVLTRDVGMRAGPSQESGECSL